MLSDDEPPVTDLGVRDRCNVGEVAQARACLRPTPRSMLVVLSSAAAMVMVSASEPPTSVSTRETVAVLAKLPSDQLVDVRTEVDRAVRRWPWSA